MLSEKYSLYGARLPDARRSYSGRKTYNIKQLWEKNHEIINLAVLGLKSPQIAEIVGVTEATVSNTVNSDLGKEKLHLMRASRDADTLDAAKKIQELTAKALLLYEQILDSEGEDSAPLGMKVNVSKHVVMTSLVSRYRLGWKVALCMRTCPSRILRSSNEEDAKLLQPVG